MMGSENYTSAAAKPTPGQLPQGIDSMAANADESIINACHKPNNGSKTDSHISVDELRSLLRKDLMEVLHEFFGEAAPSGTETQADLVLARRSSQSSTASDLCRSVPKEAVEQPSGEYFSSLSEDAKRDELNVVASQHPQSDTGCELVETRAQTQKDSQLRNSIGSYSSAHDDSDPAHLISYLQKGLSRPMDKLERLKDMPWFDRTVVVLKERIASAREPDRSGCLFNLIESQGFECVSMLVILVNVAWMVYSLDNSFESWAENGSASRAVTELFWLEHIFLGAYIVEISLRLTVHKLYFFVNNDAHWNTFDFMCVAFTALDTVLEAADPDASSVGIGYIRMMRVWKITRVLRVVRALKFFTQLGLLLKCFMQSALSLMWSVLCMVFLMFLFAIVFLQGFVGYLSATPPGQEGFDVSAANENFGTIGRGMGSLFQAITGGNDWATFYDSIFPLGLFYRAIFTFYIAFMMIATMNIISSIFIERTMRAAQPDADVLVIEREEQTLSDIDELLKLCRDLDVDQDQDGLLGLSEMERIMEDRTVRKYFEARGVHFEDVHTLYKMLLESAQAAGRPGITPERFVKACLRLNDPCSGLDMHTLAYEVKVLHKEHQHLVNHCKHEFARHHEKLHAMHGHMQTLSSTDIHV